MSIFFDFEVGPSGRRFRRAVDGDKCDIQLLEDSQTKLFGSVDIGFLIELSTLPICMINAKLEVIGFMALADHPNVPGVDPAHWEMWMRNLYQKYYLARNTLFIHFMCCTADALAFFMEEALVSVFESDPYLLQIILMVPINCPEECFLKHEAFRKRNVFKYTARNPNDVECAYYFYAALRQEFCPKLKVRRAVEEDNDDIVAFLDKKCPRLRELYGEFYISEIIGRYAQMKREVIVADCHTIAVGVMCLNAEMDYDWLQKTYELEPYHGLKKMPAFEKERNKRQNNLLKTFGEPIMLGRWSPFDYLPMFKSESIEDEPSKEKLVETKPSKTPSKVNFERRGMQLSLEFLFRHHSSEELIDKVSLSDRRLYTTSDLSVVDLLEEEPFDYEIVNIDSNLFTVPEALSFDDPLDRGSAGSRHIKICQIQRSMKRRTSNYKNTPILKPSHTKYAGKPDAFMIELFGFREDIDERHGLDLLEGAFEVMKNYDYCIIRVPCVEPSFPLLQHFTFVPSKPNVYTKHALYVAQRNSVLGKFRVRRAELIDIPQIAHLMASLDGKETIWTVENTILRRNELQAYVFFSGVSLVGVGVIEPPEHIDFVRAKFDMDSYHIHKYHFRGQGTHAGFSTLKVALVYPAFEPHYRFFIRDMMRQCDAKSVLWLTGYRNKWVIHKINCLAVAMIPLLPRTFELEYEHIEDLKNIVQLSNKLKSFSAWYMSQSLSSLPRVNVDARLVVVGASRAGMAFINKLLFRDTSSYLFFTNVTLISKHGLPYARKAVPAAAMMFLRRQTGNDRFLKSVPYSYYLNVIQGTMVEINKKEKYVKLSNESKCYYDFLFLMIGKQYQHPGYLREALERERSIQQGTFRYTRLEHPEHHEHPTCRAAAPDNVFIINNVVDANRALKFVQSLQKQLGAYKIIVYGASIHAYCCMATLLEIKVPGENIIFIEPFPPKNRAKTRVSFFCNDYVDSTVIKMLEGLNIQVYRSFYFHTWTEDVMNVATHVEFLSHYKLLRLECDAFFYYGKRSVDEQTLIAINKSGMAYDCGIVIDHQFRTRDPAIYAAGTATKYNRRYYAEHRRHKYYDSAEVGETLGAQIRNQLDPLFTENKETPRKQSVRVSFSDKVSESFSAFERRDFMYQDIADSGHRKSSVDTEGSYQLPEFKKPRVTSCVLPGGLKYLEVRPPALKSPHHYVQSLHYSGHVMETFKSGYFKLHLTNDLIVDGITCLTTENFSLEIFKHLYGLSAVMLNNVHLRYTVKKLDNFYEFFRAPWAVFLYHDQTAELFAMVKELLPKGQHQGDTLREGLRAVARKLSRTEPFTGDTKLMIRSKFEKSPHIAAVTDFVLEWLSQNDVLLPMYFQPTQAGAYSSDVTLNPAFRRRKRRLTRLLSAVY